MTQDDVVKLIPDRLNSLKEVYGIEADDAIAMLRYFHWNQEKMLEKLIDHPDNLRRIVGLEFDREMYQTLSQ